MKAWNLFAEVLGSLIPDTQKDFFQQWPRNIFAIENQVTLDASTAIRLWSANDVIRKKKEDTGWSIERRNVLKFIKVEKAVLIKEELTKIPAQGTNMENTNKK